jgi:hypothetical protein
MQQQRSQPWAKLALRRCSGTCFCCVKEENLDHHNKQVEQAMRKLMEKQQASEKKLDAMRKQAGKLYSMSPKVWVNVNPTAASTNDITFQIPSVVIQQPFSNLFP